MTKVYTTKSNATRAAKAQGLGPDSVYATEGGFTFQAPLPMATSNPAGWESAGGPTDQESAAPASGPASDFETAFAANLAEIDSQLATLAGGPASDSETPLAALVDEPPVVLRAKPAGKAARAKGKGQPAKAAPAKPAKAEPKAAQPKGKPGRKPKAPAEPKAPRDTKLSRFVALLRRPEGATLDDAMAEFGWQRHTARGAIAGAIKVKLGLTVETEKVDGKTVYRIPN